MVPAFNPMSCPQLAIPPQVMQHVAQVESDGNELAIGVVGGRLERQPRDLGEAVATARMLESKGYDYSLGIAQVNRSNLVRYGLDTFEKAFDGCANVTAGARILSECYGRSGGDWGKAFSCYYSGNFTTGYRDGYVQRILASLGTVRSDSESITVRPQTTEHLAGSPASRPVKPGSPSHCASIRSVAIDTAAGVLVSALAGDRVAEGRAGLPQPAEPVDPNHSAFVPRVTGPGSPPAAEAQLTASTTNAPFAPEQEKADAAFVF